MGCVLSYAHFEVLGLQRAEIRRLFGQGGGSHDSWRRVAKEAVQFDLSKVDSTPPKGHVVAVRVTSEDPDDGFKPTSGQVQVTFYYPADIQSDWISYTSFFLHF